MGGQFFILALPIAVALVVSRVLAGRLPVPEPILLILFGAAVSLLPSSDGIHLEPDVVLNVFLPPLVYRAAFLTAPRESRQDAVPISVLAVGLTCATALAVMYAVHLAVPSLAWAAALALGAAVAPTDPVSATTVMERVGAPRRLVTILEGESLLNDGVALTLWGLALTGLAGPLTAAGAGLTLVRVACGGILYGLVLAWLISKIRPRFQDPGSQIVLSLMTPFLAYLPATYLGVSGVLATIVTGFVFGVRGQGVLQPASRLTGQVFWNVLVYLLESTLFVLLGVQLTEVFHDAGHRPWTWGSLVLAALAVIVAVIGLRLLWTTLVLPLVRLRQPLSGRWRLVIGWAGMRGAITLAIALSIPLSVPHRGMLLFVAACVVLVTLCLQAGTLAPLLRRLGMGETESEIREMATARAAILEAALARLEDLAADDRIDDRTADVFRQLFELRLDRVRAILDEKDGAERADPEVGYVGVRRELIGAQRNKLHELYRHGIIHAETLRELDHELDVEERRRVTGGR
ncbi:MAG: Na+/H+ antiporter [Nonomuraea sp.]|nr:Na+/H+ antiporter [Nonomuraea sp.]NUP82930.1 Na+/H+ antiporter [Nonomuraea sp.]